MIQDLRASDWRYQTIDPGAADMGGIIRHLPTGFTFLTIPDSEPPQTPDDDFFVAYSLLAADEPSADRLPERRRIAQAAIYSAIGNAEVGSFYFPRDDWSDPDRINEERPAPPFIVGQDGADFWLTPFSPLPAELPA